MTQRILTALTAISFVLLAFASPHSAQEGRQVNNRTQIGDRQNDQRQIVNMAEVEKRQSDLISAYTELEAALKFLAEFQVARHSAAMHNYEAAITDIAKEKTRIANLPASDFVRQMNSLPDAKAISSIIEFSQRLRTDQQFREVINKAERYFQEGKFRPSAAKTATANSRGVVAAPSFIDPTCDFTDPRDYPSGADIAIANGLAIAAQVVYESLPDSFSVAGFSAPNVFRIAMVIAWGVLAEIVNGFQGAQWDGQWCETLQQFVQDSLSADEGYVVSLMNDPYLDLVRRIVRAAIDNAVANGVPIQCANDRYNEGVGAAARLDKYKKFRAAYQNIGAPQCQQ